MSAEQKTEGWLLERLGSVTGSRFGDVCRQDRTGKAYLKSRETTITEIVLELITGQPGAMWTSKATNWGNDQEPYARMAYEAHTKHWCEQVGFIRHPKHPQVGCSPDGIIAGMSRGYESKCPLTPTVHLDTLLHGMPIEHMEQVQGGMWVCGLDEWDFVSYHPLFPANMQLYVETIKRSDVYIANMSKHVLSAVEEINTTVKTLLAKYGVQQ